MPSPFGENTLGICTVSQSSATTSTGVPSLRQAESSENTVNVVVVSKAGMTKGDPVPTGEPFRLENHINEPSPVEARKVAEVPEQMMVSLETTGAVSRFSSTVITIGSETATHPNVSTVVNV